jgi:hypothetical protein
LLWACKLYEGLFFYRNILVLPVLFLDFLGAAVDEISDCRAVDGAWQIAHVVELEEANTLLGAELDTARWKLAKVEHRERSLASEKEGLKKDLENARSAHDTAVKDKAQVRKADQMKLQRFQDSIGKKVAELRRDTEASVAILGGRSAEFPTDASLSDFFK